ncbi:MAG: HU family DNA-binding protein [Holosporaceae bacterium]|jgi:DNA-binding protein HU-beta|nr:HU family DNA-binding protein [Holosporaceae bacterium]
MNKTELVKAVAKKSGLSIKDSGNFLNEFISVAKKTFSKGKDVILVGFGTFSVVKRKARIARNFRTKEIIKIPPYKSVRFRPGKNLKEIVNK